MSTAKATKPPIEDVIVRVPHDRVLIRLIDPPSRTAGGILLPDVAKGKPVKARVVKPGEGRTVVTTGEPIKVPFTTGEVVTIRDWAHQHTVPGYDDCAVVEMQAIEAVWSEAFLGIL